MPANDQELEIKFATDAEGLSAAFSSPLLGGGSDAQAVTRNLTSTYFDTPDQSLLARRIALRVRKSGRSAPQIAVKCPEKTADAFSRGEIEVRGRGFFPELDLFGPELSEKLKKLIGDQPLQPQIETRIKRRTRVLQIGAATVEIAFDDGVIVAQDRSVAVKELELELKTGEPAELYDLALRVAHELPLRLDIASKADRGFRLRAAAAARPVRAAAPDYGPDATLDDAIAAVLGSTLAQYLANFAPLREGDDPESIHQLRVAMRRMRSALGIFRRAAPCAEFEVFREEAKRIASALGPARESDAFCALVAAGPRKVVKDATAFEAVDELVERRRLDLYREARGFINSAQVSIFALTVQAFVTRRGWRNAVAGDGLAVLGAPANQFAAESLERLHKKAIRRGRKLLKLGAEERHKVRLSLKKLRYCAEFFGGLFGEAAEQRAYVRAAAVVQDLLGAHNDAAGAEAFLVKLGARASVDTAFAAGVVAGWCERHAEFADLELEDAWRTFKRVEPFWR